MADPFNTDGDWTAGFTYDVLGNVVRNTGVRPAILRFSHILYNFAGMARKRRVEIEGGFYHVIMRGNDRRDVFHFPEDHLKFLSLLAK